LAYLTA
jgi:hypothetical protein